MIIPFVRIAAIFVLESVMLGLIFIILYEGIERWIDQVEEFLGLKQTSRRSGKRRERLVDFQSRLSQAIKEKNQTKENVDYGDLVKISISSGVDDFSILVGIDSLPEDKLQEIRTRISDGLFATGMVRIDICRESGDI